MTTLTQRQAALTSANRVRSAMREIRGELATGLTTIPEALYDPRAGALTAHQLVLAQRGWGRARARQALRASEIRENIRVRDLTERQRATLARVTR